MGGNVYEPRTPARRVSTSTTTPREKKLNKVMQEMRELAPSERRAALSSLKKAGLTDLANALQALLPAGSHPPERKSR